MPKISVIMSVYKEPVEWIKQSIDSILNQTYSDFEFIIINDKPDRVENTTLLNYYISRDSRIKVSTNQTNLGLTKSLNKALGIATGEYIARMDADDIAHPNRFERQVRIMDNNLEIGVCGCNVCEFGVSNRILRYPEKMDSVFMFLKSPFAHPTVFIRKAILHGSHYNEEFVVSQDYGLWTELYAKGIQFYNIQDTLLNYRVSEQQISKSKLQLQHSISRLLRRKNFDNYCTINNIPLRISDSPISFNLIMSIQRSMDLPRQVMNELLFSMCCSVSNSIISLICFIYRSGIYKHISVTNQVRLLKYKVLNLDCAMF